MCHGMGDGADSMSSGDNSNLHRRHEHSGAVWPTGGALDRAALRPGLSSMDGSVMITPHALGTDLSANVPWVRYTRDAAAHTTTVTFDLWMWYGSGVVPWGLYHVTDTYVFDWPAAQQCISWYRCPHYRHDTTVTTGVPAWFLWQAVNAAGGAVSYIDTDVADVATAAAWAPWTATQSPPGPLDDWTTLVCRMLLGTDGTVAAIGLFDHSSGVPTNQYGSGLAAHGPPAVLAPIDWHYDANLRSFNIDGMGGLAIPVSTTAATIKAGGAFGYAMTQFYLNTVPAGSWEISLAQLSTDSAGRLAALAVLQPYFEATIVGPRSTATGNFTSADSKTITVVNGIIASIS
jgi:hypothetical protein